MHLKIKKSSLTHFSQCTQNVLLMAFLKFKMISYERLRNNIVRTLSFEAQPMKVVHSEHKKFPSLHERNDPSRTQNNKQHCLKTFFVRLQRYSPSSCHIVCSVAKVHDTKQVPRIL